jgi:hypothetical protein
MENQNAKRRQPFMGKSLRFGEQIAQMLKRSPLRDNNLSLFTYQPVIGFGKAHQGKGGILSDLRIGIVFKLNSQGPFQRLNERSLLRDIFN